ncbi:ketol-acid reductoisomerase [Gleimia hominis]|uniref:Ketol-acid reductoisomerase n=1 Tax=Gleimia hominis TaxID=595468 RepID=A0ABU3IC67_9ACTO|nr:ketol-acid reductoisomerase [Gleimia hominis]MDT3767967.1 ketol-acid reductoisomerase [Gleimia hominis]
MAQILYDDDADLGVIQNKKVAVVGYNALARAHALNLRDTGVDVIVGVQPEDPTGQRAAEEGLPVAPIAHAVDGADVVALLVADSAQVGIYTEQVAPNLKQDATLVFAHGFNVRYGYIDPGRHDVCLISAKSAPSELRRLFEQGQGVPATVAISDDGSGRAWEVALSYAKALGATRAGVVKTTFDEEVEAGLFGKIAVERGGILMLMQYGFETLVDAGYEPEVAYLEVCHGLRPLMELVSDASASVPVGASASEAANAQADQRASVSESESAKASIGLEAMGLEEVNTALYGALAEGPRVVAPEVKEHMREVLTRIQDGTFAQQFTEDQAGGGQELRALSEQARSHPMRRAQETLKTAFGFNN